MPEPSEEARPTPANARETWRKACLAAVTLITVGITVTASAQILWAVFSPPQVETPLGCRSGVQALLAGVRRARARAAAQSAGEREALRAFREALRPEWNAAATIRSRCQESDDQQALSAFRAVELLRYAEERAVRYEALDLSRLRQRAPRLTHALSTQ